MEQFAITVPYSFIADRVRLSWQQVRFGAEQGIFSVPEAIDLAADLLGEGDNSPQVLELACKGRGESVSDLISSLADGEGAENLDEIRRFWAFLILAWILEHRSEHKDPLDLVEKVYADLDYPEQVAPFVRYMPSDEPDLGAPALNEERLFKKWRAYLRAEGEHFASRNG